MHSLTHGTALQLYERPYWGREREYPRLTRHDKNPRSLTSKRQEITTDQADLQFECSRNVQKLFDLKSEMQLSNQSIFIDWHLHVGNMSIEWSSNWHGPCHGLWMPPATDNITMFSVTLLIAGLMFYPRLLKRIINSCSCGKVGSDMLIYLPPK